MGFLAFFPTSKDRKNKRDGGYAGLIKNEKLKRKNDAAADSSDSGSGCSSRSACTSGCEADFVCGGPQPGGGACDVEEQPSAGGAAAGCSGFNEAAIQNEELKMVLLHLMPIRFRVAACEVHARSGPSGRELQPSAGGGRLRAAAASMKPQFKMEN